MYRERIFGLITRAHVDMNYGCHIARKIRKRYDELMNITHIARTHRKKIYYGAPIIFLLLLGTTSTLAAGNAFLFGAQSTRFPSVGDAIPVVLEVSTKTSINAVGGTIVFAPDIIVADSVTRSSSIIDLWSEEPVISNQSGTIHFSGGIVGTNVSEGGSHGPVFVVNFHAVKSGKVVVGLKDGELLANNGEGTNVLSGANTLTFYVRAQGAASPDMNADGVLSLSDVNSLYLKTFRAYDAKYDVNSDGKVDWSDVKVVLGLL